MIADYHLLYFSVTAVFIAVFFLFQGQRWAELEIFGRVLIPVIFLYIAMILYPRDIPLKWIELLGAVIIVLAAVIIAVDFVFQLVMRIKNSLSRLRNAFSYENVLSKAMPEYIIEICRAIELLTNNGLGGLIVVERRDNLAEAINGGIPFDAELKAEIITALFDKNSSVHDGAIIVSRGRIARVRTILPVSANAVLPHNMGLRHRSAIGITEKTDAIAFVASEQRREMSIAYRGGIVRANSPKALLKLASMALKRKNIQPFQQAHPRKKTLASADEFSSDYVGRA
jgi:DNA integrity scanning protein DisA with diadenylate cyclase activity